MLKGALSATGNEGIGLGAHLSMILSWSFP